MNDSKESIKSLIQSRGTIGQQLYQIRVSKQLTMKQVCTETNIPEYIVDNMEIGRGSLKMPELYRLAKYYGKKVQISLID